MLHYCNWKWFSSFWVVVVSLSPSLPLSLSLSLLFLACDSHSDSKASSVAFAGCSSNPGCCIYSKGQPLIRCWAGRETFSLLRINSSQIRSTWGSLKEELAHVVMVWRALKRLMEEGQSRRWAAVTCCLWLTADEPHSGEASEIKVDCHAEEARLVLHSGLGRVGRMEKCRMLRQENWHFALHTSVVLCLRLRSPCQGEWEELRGGSGGETPPTHLLKRRLGVSLFTNI